MENKIKKSFDQIHAGEILKSRTRTLLQEKAKEYSGKKRKGMSNWIPAAVVLAVTALLLMGAGYWFLGVPTTEVYLEINPSVEIAINRLDRVIGVTGMNEGGQALVNEMDGLIFTDYMETVDRILESDTVKSLLEEEIMTIAVTGKEEDQTGAIFQELQKTAEGNRNICCGYLGTEQMRQARELGMSYGKYLAYQELQNLETGISPEQVQDMTTEEIRRWIARLQGQAGNGYGWGKGKKHT